MNKPLTMTIKEIKTKIANICNESGLPPVILDLIMQGIYSEIHYLVEKQTAEEETAYAEAIKNNVKKDNEENEDLKEGLVKS